jgi:DNA-binding LacI/PurR family transcriptional regulator
MRASFDRLRGYQDGLNNAGEVVRPDWIKDSEFTFDGGYTAAKLLMDQPAHPTCIFAGNDEAAFGVLFALQELGISVPDQVSVCGYDDLEYAKNIWPSLTTVHQPAEEMVEMATRILIQLLKGKPVEPLQLTFPAHLVIRKSTAPPPQK